MAGKKKLRRVSTKDTKTGAQQYTRPGVTGDQIMDKRKPGRSEDQGLMVARAAGIANAERALYRMRRDYGTAGANLGTKNKPRGGR